MHERKIRTAVQIDENSGLEASHSDGSQTNAKYTCALPRQRYARKKFSGAIIYMVRL